MVILTLNQNMNEESNLKILTVRYVNIRASNVENLSFYETEKMSPKMVTTFGKALAQLLLISYYLYALSRNSSAYHMFFEIQEASC